MKELEINNLLSDPTTSSFPLSNGIVLGNRIPKDYFITSGSGESDITIHAGSYHLALKEAGIERANIITYSSILPGIADEVSKPENYAHGEVMETIMAVANGEKGEEISAGIIVGWLYERQSNQRYGGLVCEHNGTYNEKELINRLNASLQELYSNEFSENYYLDHIMTFKKSIMVKKKYGTALTAICFINYFYPCVQNMIYR